MQYRRLGKSALVVSQIGVGSSSFGSVVSEREAASILDHAFGRGVNFVDTADQYGEGRSEELVGQLIAPDRSRWILATKFGGSSVSKSIKAPALRKATIEGVDASLRRLRTDYIDLLYVHRENDTNNVKELVDIFADLIREGKIRHYGLSNHRAWRVAEFSHISREQGVELPAASQPLYNLANRQAEIEHLTACEYYGVGVISYSPLARGMLTGKYLPGVRPAPNTRAGRNEKRFMETEWRPETIELAQELKRHAISRHLTTGQFAIAWVLANRLISAIVAGPRTLKQWKEYLPALSYVWTAEDEDFVNQRVAPGHPSTPGYNDPAYSFFGRSIS